MSSQPKDQKSLKKSEFLNTAQISTGTIEVPNNFSICIYVQGCNRRCPGCHNEHLWDFDGGNKIYIQDIPSIIKEYELCDWVCWLGGEPLDQQEQVIEFSEEFKKFGKKICLYTGNQFENINPECSKVFDLIIDGEYIQSRGPVTKTGTNQKIWKKIDAGWQLIKSWEQLVLKKEN